MASPPPAPLASVGPAGMPATWRAASCMPDHCFCERIREAGIRQPANTGSSLAFVAAGVWVLASRRRIGTRGPAARLVLGSALVLVGVGSAFYHATLSFAGQFADVFGMYLLAVFVALYAWARLRTVGDALLVAAYAVINALLAVLLLYAPALRRYAFAVVLLGGLALELRARRRRVGAAEGRWIGAAVAVLTVGFVAWVLDITRLACWPDSQLQGHAVWHVAGAAASLLLFRYYASESSGGMRSTAR